MMKKGMKRIVSGLLTAAMVLTGIGANTKTASANESTMQNYVYDGYEVTFMVTSAWDGAFNAEVKIANTGDETINDWALEFDFDHEIQNMWNATVVEHSEDNYVVKNNDWNANIKPGEGAGFGMTVQCEGDITFPDNFSFVMEEESVTAQSYSAEFTLYSDWGTGCNGAIILSNLTTESIENWQLEFDYDREIVNISNAVIVSCEQGHYVIKNAEYNADIAGNSSVHIGIVAGEGAADERPENFTMQQTVVGDATTGTESGSEEVPEEDIIAERLSGIVYKEPETEHIKYDEETGTSYIDNQLLMIVEEGITLEEAKLLADEIHAEVVGYIILTGDYQLELSQSYSIEELNSLIERLISFPQVCEARIHELYENESCVIPDDPEWESSWNVSAPEGDNWGLEVIDALGAWEYDGVTVNIGIIDTMFDTQHADLYFEEVWGNIDRDTLVSEYRQTEVSKKKIDLGHGTHVSGIMAALYNNGEGISGVSKNAKLFAASITDIDFENDNSHPLNRVSEMEIKYSVAYLIFNNCRVINYSMGGVVTDENRVAAARNVYYNFLRKFLDEGYDFLIVQAAGNEKSDTNLITGFASITREMDEELYNRIIVVGAVEQDVYNTVDTSVGNRVAGVRYWETSNYGERVDVCAPGVKIFSTVPGNLYSDIVVENNSGVLYWSGTSQAAPYVSGVASLCFSVNPDLTGEQVKQIICNPEYGTVYDERSGKEYPMLNAQKSVYNALPENSIGEGSGDIDSFGWIKGQLFSLEGLGDLPTREAKEIYSKLDACVTVYPINADTGEAEYLGGISVDCGSLCTFEILLEAGDYLMKVHRTGYIDKEYNKIHIEGGEAVYLDVNLIPERCNSEAPNEVYGIVKDATLQKTLSDVNITVVKGGYIGGISDYIEKIELSEMDIVPLNDNNYDGSYRIPLESGYYTLIFQKDGYITNYMEVYSAQGLYSQDIVMSPLLNNNEYRIVLTWGEVPADLDSHLICEEKNELLYHVYWANRTYYEDEELIARLDRDDTNAEGPETITVTVLIDEERSYRYYVYDYSNGWKSNSTELSGSGARIELYKENEHLGSYDVPKNQTGTIWDVFEIINGNVVEVNSIS